MISLDRLDVGYGDFLALQGITLEIGEGSVGLLGPNGAGKSTLIKTLIGHLSARRGTGSVLGLDIRDQFLDIRQRVGYLPERECMFPGMNGVASVAYAGELVGMSRSAAQQRAHEVLNYVGLAEERYRPTKSYSAGMVQRIKLAQALVHDPKLLFLDEPTNGMDPRGRNEMLELISDVSENKGINVLLSSHLLPDVEAVCRHVVVLARGRVLSDGNIEEMRTATSSLFIVRVKGDGEGFADALRHLGCAVDRHERGDLKVKLAEGKDTDLFWEVARRTGTQVRHLAPSRRSLEDVFLEALEVEEEPGVATAKEAV